MGSCRFTLAGCAVACRELKYPAAAQLIVAQGMGPERIEQLFATSASKTWRRDAALILLCGSVAHYRAQPSTWSADPQASLVRGLVGDDFGSISDTATRLVREHWSAIQELAIGAEAA